MSADTPETFLRAYEIWALLVGLSVGSFLNVVIGRVPAGESIVSPGSRCPRCRKPIAWFDNIPVLSWLVLRAKCRNCALPISPRYPVVELLVGMLGLAVARRDGLEWNALVDFAFVALLVAIAYIDLDFWWIPDELSVPGIALGLLGGWLLPDRTILDALIGGFSGFAVLALVSIVGARVFKKEAMGQGDWFLLAMIGTNLGWKALLPVVLLSSLQGAVIGGALVLAKINRGSAPMPAEAPAPAAGGAEGVAATTEDDWQPDATAIPFGPFLVVAALEWLFLSDWLLLVYDGLIARLVP